MEDTSNWLTKDWTQGDLNALVKLLEREAGKGTARGILNGTIKFRFDKAYVGLADFFRNRPGLQVTENFLGWILAAALETEESLHAESGKPFYSPRPMNDKEIRKKLGEGHVFENARSFCTYLKGFLELQWDGGEGLLHTGPKMNLFYVLGSDRNIFVVRVYRDVKEWKVDAHLLDNTMPWGSGMKVFPASSSELKPKSA